MKVSFTLTTMTNDCPNVHFWSVTVHCVPCFMVQEEVIDDVHRASDTKIGFVKSKYRSHWTDCTTYRIPWNGQMNSKQRKYFFLILPTATELNMWANYISTTVSNIGGLRFIWSDSSFEINKFKHFNKSLKLSTVDSFAFIWDGRKKKRLHEFMEIHISGEWMRTQGASLHR